MATNDNVNIRIPARLWHEVRELVAERKRQGDMTYTSATQFVALAIRHQIEEDDGRSTA